MTVPAELIQLFTEQQPYVAQVQARVRDLVLAHVEPLGYAFAARSKTLESVAEKIESGRYAGWTELDDLYACTIVVPTLEEEPALLEHLGGVFDIVVVRKRGETTKDPQVFRFDSTRVIARLGANSGITEQGGVSSLLFEIQIRTAFEHAWSATTHKLAYKGEHIDWRRLRLAAQLKAAVEQLDLLIAGYDSVAGFIHTQNWPEISAKSQIEALFRNAIVDGKIPSELGPASWTRFCDNVYDLIRKGHRGPMKEFGKRIDTALAVLSTRIAADATQFPMSLSLFQYALGALAEADLVPKTFESYFPLITESLSTLFPAVKKIETRFKIVAAV